MSGEVLGLRWGAFVAVGAAMLVLGVLSVAFADVAGQALVVFLGWLLVVVGTLHMAAAIRVRAWRGGLMSILVAGLRVAAGVLFIAAPRAWAAAFVVLVGAFLLVDGCFRLLLAFQAYPARGWGYVLAAGCVAILLGLLLVFELSGDGAFVVGLLFGIHLLFDGWATVMLAVAARSSLR